MICHSGGTIAQSLAFASPCVRPRSRRDRNAVLPIDPSGDYEALLITWDISVLNTQFDNFIRFFFCPRELLSLASMQNYTYHLNGDSSFLLFISLLLNQGTRLLSALLSLDTKATPATRTAE